MAKGPQNLDRRTLLMAAASTVLLPGCATLQTRLQSVEKPKLAYKNLKLKKLSWKAADINLRFDLKNPYPIPLRVLKYDWDLKLDAKPFLKGKHGKEIAVNPESTGQITVPFTFVFQDVFKALQSAKGQKEVPFSLGGTLTVNSPIGPIGLPLRAKGNLPILQKPKVRMRNIKAKLQSLTTLKIDIGLGVKNENAYKLTLDNLGYNLKLEGFQVAKGIAAKGKAVGNTEEFKLNLPINVDLLSLGSAVVSTIKKGKFRYNLGTNLKLKTPFGMAPLDWSDDGTIKLY